MSPQEITLMGIFQGDISIIWIADWNLEVGKSIPESKSKVEHVFLVIAVCSMSCLLCMVGFT